MTVLECTLWFTVGAFVGIIGLILFLSYANQIPLSTIHTHIGLTIYKSKLIKNKSSKRLSHKQITKSFDPSKYPKDKYPYIDYQPQTIPSPEFQACDQMLFKLTQNRRESDLKLSIKQLIESKRNAMKRLININQCPLNCNIQYEILNLHITNEIYNIPIYWLKYPNSNFKKNGLIIYCHGGRYIAGSPKHGFSMLSLISKLTGMIICAIEYNKPPEFPLPRCVEDVCNIYKYFNNKNSKSKYINLNNFNHKKTVFIGESAGGGLILLALQKIKQLKLPMPSCCWSIAPWTNIALDFDSLDRNDGIDSMINTNVFRRVLHEIVGNNDINGNKIKQEKEEECDLHDPKVSPFYGNWNDICPIFFQVGATEILLDDTLKAAEKAYQSGVKVKVEIHPYLMHAYPILVNIMPEAREACVRAAEFIRQHTNTVASQP